jgi:guanine deaminase
VFYAASREQEGEHYEDGGRYMSLATFYDEYAKPADEQRLPSQHVPLDDPTAAFRRWTEEHPST